MGEKKQRTVLGAYQGLKIDRWARGLEQVRSAGAILGETGRAVRLHEAIQSPHWRKKSGGGSGAILIVLDRGHE